MERNNYRPANVRYVHASIPNSPCLLRHLEISCCFSGHIADKYGYAADIGFAKAYVKLRHWLSDKSGTTWGQFKTSRNTSLKTTNPLAELAPTIILWTFAIELQLSSQHPYPAVVSATEVDHNGRMTICADMMSNCNMHFCMAWLTGDIIYSITRLPTPRSRAEMSYKRTGKLKDWEKKWEI